MKTCITKGKRKWAGQFGEFSDYIYVLGVSPDGREEI